MSLYNMSLYNMSLYTAIIIEPREHKALYFVLNNFLHNLTNEWNVIIFHGDKNIDYVKQIVNRLDESYKKRITNLINLNIDNLNNQTYSNLLLSKSFYNYIPTETFLIFQTDSIILKENKERINLFLQYDYVGGPWKHMNNIVGNGGLSIRKKSKMLEIIKSKGYQSGINEDVYFSTNIDKSIVYNVPSYTIAKMFSVEAIFYDDPFGIHNCWKYLNKDEMALLTNKYSEIKELLHLQ